MNWIFENVYHYADGDVYVVTLQHIFIGDDFHASLEIRRAKLT